MSKFTVRCYKVAVWLVGVGVAIASIGVAVSSVQSAKTRTEDDHVFRLRLNGRL